MSDKPKIIPDTSGRLYNHDTGAMEDLTEDKVDAAVRAGTHTFFKDIDIPVVSPDGELGSIKSEDAYEMFNKGYRWATKADKDAWYNDSVESIKEKNYGNQSGAAAAMGALDTATFGASSLALRGLEESGITGTGLTEAAKEIKHRNVGAYTAGAVAGALLPTAAAGIAKAGAKLGTAAAEMATGTAGVLELGSAAKAASTPAAGIAERLVTLPQQVSNVGKAVEAATLAKIAPVTSQMTGKLSRQLVENVASKVASGIVEGTAYGLGAGISEASLGRPDEVVDSLVSNVTMGALTGGAIGSLIGAAPVAGSALKDLGGRAVSGVRSTVEEAARKTLRSGAVASARNKGMSEDLVNVLRESFNDEGAVQTAMKLHEAGKLQEFESFVRDTEKQLRRTAQQESKGLTKALTRVLDKTEGDTKKYIASAIKESGEDIYKAVDAIEADVRTAYQYFDENLVKLKADPYAGKARLDTTKVINALEDGIDNFKAAGTKGELRRSLEILKNPNISAADEQAVLSSIRKSMPDSLASGPAKESRDRIVSLVDDVTARTVPTNLADSWGASIEKLLASRDPATEAVGKSLRGHLNVLKMAQSEADSFAALRALKQEATDIVYSRAIKGPGMGTMNKLNSEVVKYLRNHPNQELAKQLLDVDTYYSAYKSIKDGLVNRSGVKGGSMRRLFDDPTFGKRIRPALDRFSEFMPEIEKVVGNVKNVAKRDSAMKAMVSEMNARLNLSDTAKLDVADMRDLFDIIGYDKNISSKLDRLQAVNQLMQTTADMTVPDRLVALAKAAGNDDAVKRVQEMLPHSQLMEKVAQIRSMGKAADEGSMASMAANVASYAAVGPLGPPMVHTARKVANIYRSPWTAHETFRAIQSVTNGGAKVVSAVGAAVTDALIKGNTKGLKAAMPAIIMEKAASEGGRKDKMKKFKELQATLPDVGSPAQIAKTIEDNLGHIANVPNIKQAITARTLATAQYLQANMPVDPTAGYANIAGNSDWEPSDQELSRFLRQVEAANNPMKSLAKIADGSITSEEVETVKALHPNLFANLRDAVVSGIIEVKGQVPYQSKLIISSVFGVPVDYSTTPEFISTMQSAYTPTDKGGRPETAETRKKNLNINPLDSLTEAARISYGRGK